MAVWIHSLKALSENETDLCRAGINATMQCAFDPLPVVEVFFFLCCFCVLVYYFLFNFLFFRFQMFCTTNSEELYILDYFL